MDLKNYRINGTQMVEGLRLGSNVLIHQNFAYIIINEKNGVVHLKCRRKNCSGTAVIHLRENLLDGEIICLQKHNHCKDINYIKKIKFRYELRKECRNSSGRSMKQIFNEVSERCGDSCGVLFGSVGSLMLRAKNAEKSLRNDSVIASDCDAENLSNVKDVWNDPMHFVDIIEPRVDDNIKTHWTEDLRKCTVPGLQVIEHLRSGNQILTHDNFTYLTRNKRKDTVYLRCKENICMGTAVIYLNEKGEGILKKLKPHNHPAYNHKCLNKEKLDQVTSRISDESYESSMYIIKASDFSSSMEEEEKSKSNSTINSDVIIEDCLEETKSSEIEIYDSSMDFNRDENSSDSIRENHKELSINIDREFFELDLKNSVSSPEKKRICRRGRPQKLQSDSDTELPEDLTEYIKTFSIPAVEMLEGLRLGSLVLIYKNYVYLTKSRKKRIVNLRCRVGSCAGSASAYLLKDRTGIFKCLKHHTHSPDIEYINILKFRKSVRIEALKNQSLTNKQIYDKVSARFHGKCKVAFRSIVGLITRSRRRSDSTLLTEDNSSHDLVPLSPHPHSTAEDKHDECDNLSIDIRKPSKDDLELKKEDRVNMFEMKKVTVLKRKLKSFSIPGVEILDGFRLDGLTIAYDNYTYVSSNQKCSNIYLRCRIKACRGSGMICLQDNHKGYVKLGNVHNHPPDIKSINILRFRSDLRNESVQSPKLSLKEVFDKVFARHSTTLPNVTFSSVEALLARSRRLSKPPTPSNLEDLCDILNCDDWHDRGRSFHTPTPHPWFRGTHTAQDGSKISAFINQCICHTIKAFQPTMLHVDATFKLQPEIFRFHYLLSCHLVINDKIFGFGFFIINRKSASCYKKCFEIIHSLTGPLKPSLVYTDYEPPLQMAIRNFWPAIVIKNCYYHYVQSIITKCQEDDKDVLLDKDKREIVKQYLALPLLPAEHIVTGHLVITDYLNRSLINNFWTLNDYFGQYWMDLIGPSVFSVYETRNNVNDSVELFHNRMKHNLGSRKTMWSFVDALKILCHNEEVDYLSCLGYGDTKLPSKKVIHMQQDKALAISLKKLNRELLSISKTSTDDAQTTIKTAVATFLIAAAQALDGLLERESQEPKQSKVTMPKRVLVSSEQNEIVIEEVEEIDMDCNNTHLGTEIAPDIVEIDESSVIKIVKEELLDHDYGYEVVIYEND